MYDAVVDKKTSRSGISSPEEFVVVQMHFQQFTSHLGLHAISMTASPLCNIDL